MKFRGALKGVTRDYDSDNHLIILEVKEGNIEDLDNVLHRDLSIQIETWREPKSAEANRLFWHCISKIAKEKNQSKWKTYLQVLKDYGEYTYVCVKPEAVDAMKEQWRECEVIGDLKINGKDAVQLLCYYGISSYNTKEFANIIDSVIAEMKDAGIPTPADEELERALEQWNQYCNTKKSVLSVEE